MTNEERDEVIRFFETMLKLESNIKDAHFEYSKLALEALKQEPSSSEKPNKWIPVSERLPKAGEYVGNVAKYYLVQNEYGDMLVARYTHSEYWEQMYQFNPIDDEIVAWMPLPEPYKAESKE